MLMTVFAAPPQRASARSVNAPSKSSRRCAPPPRVRIYHCAAPPIARCGCSVVNRARESCSSRREEDRGAAMTSDHEHEHEHDSRLWYFAYGSNLHRSIFLERHQMHPLAVGWGWIE